jgi:hypothetical protein
MAGWQEKPLVLADERKLDTSHINAAIATWNHFRMWVTEDFAIDIEKVQDFYDICIHRRGFPSAHIGNLTLDAVGVSLSRFLEDVRIRTKKGGFAPNEYE